MQKKTLAIQDRSDKYSTDKKNLLAVVSKLKDDSFIEAMEVKGHLGIGGRVWSMMLRDAELMAYSAKKPNGNRIFASKALIKALLADGGWQK